MTGEKQEEIYMMYKKSVRMLALCLVLAFVCSAIGGCGSGEENTDVWKGEYSLTPAPDFSGTGAGTDVFLGWSKEEAEPIGDFSLAFMREAVAQAHVQGAKNPVLSPVSVYLALLLAAMGSDGETRAEFEDVLRLPADKWGAYGGQLMRFMNQSDGSERLSTANALWVDEGTPVEETYLEQVATQMYSEIFKLDLSTKEAQKAVNEWVAKRTEGMIEEFRSEPYADTVKMAILNAVYLDAKWEEAFDRMKTDTLPFYRDDGSEVTASFLIDWPTHREYIKEETLEGIVLPYQSGRLAFLALRATDGRKPEELLAELSAERLQSLAAGAAEVPMDFAMPRFTLEYNQTLLPVLEEMGLSAALKPEKADFSGITGAGEGSLHIGEVTQKVKIQVDEKGTKAAAATEVTMAGGASDTQLVQLYFDSPFLYAVIERETGTVLFMGIMENPPAAE